MQRLRGMVYVGIGIFSGCFLALVFGLQIFLSLHERPSAAASDEVTETSRIFTEQVQATLQKKP